MELRDLKALVAVAQEEQFRRAAERLLVSQPPLSQHIMALEQEAGATRLERRTRRVELTATGRVCSHTALSDPKSVMIVGQPHPFVNMPLEVFND